VTSPTRSRPKDCVWQQPDGRPGLRAGVNPALARVLARLSSVQKSGAGFTAKCPSHPDRQASLSIGEGRDGRVLLYCHAGCELRYVVAAIGLELADVFPERRRRRHG
jgi:hypothetical protein